ncbi:MAG: class D sortase [Oscillospiraceae bacterium]|nr:class D sortase [Oscillospiraceae bacterium]
MKRRLTTLLAACLMLTAFSMPASAVDYNFTGPGPGLFAEPTSDNTIYVAVRDDTNIDRSKTAAIVPPTFGSPTSYTLNAGEYLTPNLVNQDRGATVTAYTGVTGSNGTSGSGGVTLLPLTSLNSVENPFTVTTNGGAGNTTSGWRDTRFTSVTSDLYYSGGQLGTLRIPRIGLTVKVYQGTDSATLLKGAGHFTDTSIWDGNIALAAHNRGVNNHFGKIHTLARGDRITLETKLGTRTYSVYSVSKIDVDDVTILDSTGENIITLVTCVMDQPSYRWCIKASEIV